MCPIICRDTYDNVFVRCFETCTHARVSSSRHLDIPLIGAAEGGLQLAQDDFGNGLSSPVFSPLPGSCSIHTNCSFSIAFFTSRRFSLSLSGCPILGYVGARIVSDATTVRVHRAPQSTHKTVISQHICCAACCNGLFSCCGCCACVCCSSTVPPVMV